MKQLKKMKKGFSLIEVMIIFTLLSVILAASIPMITKKANPVPNKISHGVYRCINTENGLLEELYSGTRKIRSKEVTSCSFKVPNAPAYKVDMYSAGSGGTEYGEITSSRDEDRTSYYTMAEGLTENQNPIMLPGENELYNMFNGKYLIRSIFTGDAGNGGNTTLGFESPYYARCGIDFNWYKNKLDELEKEKAKYDKVDPWTAINGVKHWDSNASGFSVYNQSLKNYNAFVSGKYDNGEQFINEDGMIFRWQMFGARWQALMFADGIIQQLIWDHSIITLNNLSFQEAYYNNQHVSRLFTVQDGYYYDDDDPVYKKIMDINKFRFHPSFMVYVSYTYHEDGETEARADAKSRMRTLNQIIANSLSTSGLFNNMEKLNNAARTVADRYADNAGIWKKSEGSDLEEELDALNGDVRSHSHSMVIKYDKDGTDEYFSGVLFNEVVDDIINEYNIRTAEEQRKLDEIEAEIKALKDEYNGAKIGENKYSDYVKDNSWANSSANSYTFNSTYGGENLKNLAANKYVRGQVEHFCRYAFKNYFAKTYKSPVNTVSFDTRYKADFGADRGRGAYSRIKYKINYSKNVGTTMAQYLKNLVSTGLGGYYPVNEDGNFITQGDISSVDDGASKNCLLDKNSTYYTNNSNRDTFNCHAGDGADRTSPKVRWRISSGNFIEVMNSLPKGGQGKHYDIAPNGITETPNYTVTKLEELYQVFSGRNYANLISENNPTTTDAVFSTATDSNNYTTDNVLEGKTGDRINNALSLNNDGDPILQTPRLKILSNLWKKTYRVGAHGTKGKKESFEVTNLGENCTFTVPAPGKPFRLNIDEINEEKMNKLLTTKMVCKDSSNNVVMQKEVLGTSYDPGVVTGYTHDDAGINISQFIWNLSYLKGGTPITSQPQQKIADHTTWKQSSLWAKVYKKFMVDTNNNYDLSNTHKVGHAGQGTTLVDKCTVAKGKYTAQMQYLIDYFTDNDSSNPAKDKDLKTGNTDFSNTQPNLQRTHSSYRYTRNYDVVKDIGKAKEETKDGFLNGYDCYGAVKDDGTGQIVIDSNSDYNKNGIITIKAGSGGGGAVVITW